MQSVPLSPRFPDSHLLPLITRRHARRSSWKDPRHRCQRLHCPVDRQGSPRARLLRPRHRPLAREGQRHQAHLRPDLRRSPRVCRHRRLHGGQSSPRPLLLSPPSGPLPRVSHPRRARSTRLSRGSTALCTPPRRSVPRATTPTPSSAPPSRASSPSSQRLTRPGRRSNASSTSPPSPLS